MDPHHWLDANGDLPASGRIRARALRVAQFIEYGGPMPQGTARETLVPCKRRPGGKPCPGLIWVSKELDDAIVAFCMGCRGEEMHIHEWQDTQWADGPMEPINPLTGAPLTDEPETDAGDALRRALQLLGSSLTSEQVVARIANAKNPSDVLRAVMESAKRPPPTSIVEQVLPLLMEAWNNTPRAELGGRSPSQMQGATSGSQTNSVGAARDASPSVVKVGRNDPCPCGSGRKHKKCCLSRTLN